LFFGGEVIKPFAFALTVGLVVGTYSSIFVAAPVVLAWDENQKKKKNS
jgi:preprotein translocase subunit SecF